MLDYIHTIRQASMACVKFATGKLAVMVARDAMTIALSCVMRSCTGIGVLLFLQLVHQITCGEIP